MGRTRYLKPDFFKDEDLAEIDYQYRLLFAGLWTIADKAGRLEYRPKRIKAEVFPYDNVHIENGIDALAKKKSNSDRPFIQLYRKGDRTYIQILSWEEHQKPHHTERESEIPDPPPLNDCLNNIKKKRSVHDASAPLSNGYVTVRTPLNQEEAFSKVWSKYPNRVGRKEALRHFKASVKTEQDLNNIHKALRNYLLSDRVKRGFCQNGSTWFNNWADWIDPPDRKQYGDVSRRPARPGFKPGEKRYDPKVKSLTQGVAEKIGGGR